MYSLKPSFSHPLFFIALSLFALHQLLQKVFLLSIPVLDNWGDPLMGSILLLFLWRFERFRLIRVSPLQPFRMLELGVFGGFCFVVSECLFPLLSSSFHFDWLDAVAIFIGVGLYHFFVNRSLSGGR
jgi:hypothetical protein